MDALIIALAIVIILAWLSRKLVTIGNGLCKFGQDLTEIASTLKKTPVQNTRKQDTKSEDHQDTKGGSDEEYLDAVRREIRDLTAGHDA